MSATPTERRPTGERGARRRGPRALLWAGVACCGAALALEGGPGAVSSGAVSSGSGGAHRQAESPARGGPGSDGCLECHAGIEAMHPQADLSCVDCHGGDATARKKLAAHVQPLTRDPGDERVDPLDTDLAYRQFVDPMDLRIVERTCGECHADLVDDLFHSLHGTTAGHLSDGFYEMGIHEERGSRYSVVPVTRRSGEEGEVERLVQPPPFRAYEPADRLATHFPDLTRKECMQCHLWSEGRAVRGRIGFDGDYRGQGCGACHVPYARSGLSDSADASIDHGEPGHPRRHVLTRAPSTDTCTTCHYGDASIGLHFRGLSQLPPGAAGGPEVPGTTDSPLNRVFYLDDPELTPPDVHHERGMHCIDCHTLGDVMGDGRLHGQMEHAVEISCQACHGTFEARSTLRTERGTPLTHLRADADGRVWLTSKVTGEEHEVAQVVDVLDPGHRRYNKEAARAMTPAHAGVECYTCHAGWNVNFLGFHFYRNEALTQLDLLSGRRTPGRVTTQEKVFSTWKSFYAGLNESGRVAPYLTGFSTMGTVDDADGRRVLDQEMPVTAAGLSGMTMIHHQLHTVRPTARSCVECHRSSATWGMGSVNFRLARQLAFVADRRGIEVVALNRGQLAASTPLAKLVLPDVVEIEIDAEPLQGHAQYLYAAEGGRGIHVVDVRDPARPRRVAFIESVGPRGMTLAGDYLLSADGEGGLRIYDVSEPEKIRRVGAVPMFDAHEVVVRWPYAYVADGPGGLTIVDVRAPIAPRVVGSLDTAYGAGAVNAALDVEVLFQYSRPEVDFEDEPAPYRTDARNLCAVLDENAGLLLVDVTEPTHPEVLWPQAARTGRTESRRPTTYTYRSLALRSHVDLASPAGGARTTERDYVYFLEENLRDNGRARSWLRVVDVSDPSRPEPGARVRTGDAAEMLVAAAFYNTPFLQPVGLVAGSEGVLALDLTVSAEPVELGLLSALRRSWVVAVEEFPLDEMIAADGRRLKDVSHEGSRWLWRAEIERVLDVPGEALGTLDPGTEPPPIRGASARAFFARLDTDGDGLLSAEDEYERAGGAAADDNGDGRITLAELAEMGRTLGDPRTAVAAGEPAPFLETRVDPDGDLARLLDGTNPYDHDRDRDGRLDPREMSRALFAALDLDGDGRLSLAELSRHPGALRQLRYGDLRALEQFGRRDLNKGGTIGPRELEVADRDWEALDRDADGFVQLAVDVDPWWRRQGYVGPLSEWPTRQPVVVGLPPDITVERVFAVFDASADGRLTQRELKARPALFEQLDRDGDDVVTEDEVGYWVGVVTEGGVDVTVDGFVERWDLDGSGTVEDEELPASARIPLRRDGPRR